MSTRARLAATLGGAVVLGLFLLIGQAGSAGEEKDTTATVNKIAVLIEKGAASAAQAAAKALAKDAEVEEVMHLFKPRKKKGIGVGKPADYITPDGIEQQFLNLGRDEPSPAMLKKAAAALEKMGYQSAAIAEFTLAKPPEKSEGKKTPQQWTAYAKEMREASTGFVQAVKTGSPAAVHKAAEKVNTACSSCHADFRD